MRAHSRRAACTGQAALRGVPRGVAGEPGVSARSRAQSTPEVSTIESLSHEGRGVTHHAGKVVFVEDALPGERVEWMRSKRGPNFDEARLLQILEASPD